MAPKLSTFCRMLNTWMSPAAVPFLLKLACLCSQYYHLLKQHSSSSCVCAAQGLLKPYTVRDDRERQERLVALMLPKQLAPAGDDDEPADEYAPP